MGSEEYNSSERLDETSKKGLCWFELNRTGMARWGNCRQVIFGDQKEDNTPQMSSNVIEGGDERDGGESVTVVESLVASGTEKRKRPLGQLREIRIPRHTKQRQSSGFQKCKQHKQRNSVDRWSVERYKLAEQHMLEVMKAEGAVFEKPISRPILRSAARKRIGDTGLLDHLLKHIDGKVAPGGAERFRRCYNTNGVMEYWLESADLVNIKREAGVPDRSWVPPSWWKLGDAPQESGELKLLKEEMAKLRSDMQEVLSKQKEQEVSCTIEEMHKEFVRWKAKTDQGLAEISSSLSSMQDMYKDLVTWKAKTEHQLLGISNSLNSMQASKQWTTTFCPSSERWEDWLESTNLDGLQEGFAPWLESADLVNVGQETVVQEPYLVPQPILKPSCSPSRDLICARELELLKEEMAKIKRDVQELVPRRQMTI
ncbi:protein DYAD isoform X1 [Carica papaya]|uniref:protein DYAD isoform X1 n=2 Tax=Carica papaya TaxID=3649 RepID=UPI000B8CFBA7|nr:protein DYAD isoform X1 [Carica papaya]XP_021889877.1 protein DYAD isoform X1 [Carica papaya]XP_021889879.1 protein DYAD isoform X1 [Carica papaya]